MGDIPPTLQEQLIGNILRDDHLERLDTASPLRITRDLVRSHSPPNQHPRGSINHTDNMQGTDIGLAPNLEKEPLRSSLEYFTYYYSTPVLGWDFTNFSRVPSPPGNMTAEEFFTEYEISDLTSSGPHGGQQTQTSQPPQPQQPQQAQSMPCLHVPTQPSQTPVSLDSSSTPNSKRRKTKTKDQRQTKKKALSVPNITTSTISEIVPSPSIPPTVDRPLRVPGSTHLPGFQTLAFTAVNYQLRVNKQPPAQTVYQRILKPFPAVMLLGSESNDTYDLFVEASLLRSDSNVELPLCLDGTRIVRISPGQFTLFKRLKILSTTQQQGTLFRLKFQLKRYQEGGFATIHGVSAISAPIEVFSHTYYLNNRGRGRNAPPPPPTVTEVLPHRGSASGGTRVVILGANFVDSNKLLVKFGDVVVRPQFHENKTLICSTLPGPPNTTVEVRVANDGVEYCDTLATFTFD